MKKVLIFIGLLCITGTVFSQNDIQFSQYMFNEITFNPAAVGNTDNLDVSALAREQWLGFEQHPSSQFLNAHTYLKKLKSGVGINIINDRLGFESTLNAKLLYSYRVHLSENTYMAFGLGMGLLNRGLEGSSLIYENPLDAYAIKTDRNELKPDFDFGFGIVHKKLSFGLSTTHVQQGKEVKHTLNVPRHYYSYVKWVLPVNDKINLVPSVRLKSTIYANQVDVNTIAEFNDAFWVGLSYRIQDAYVGMVGVKINGKLRIGYSYDYDASSIKSYNSGSHELYVSYSFKDLNKAPVNIKSPRLFN